MPTDPPPILSALQAFAEAVTKKTNALTAGEPEAQLRAPFERFMHTLEDVRHIPIQCKDESKVGRIGKPDYAILSNDLLIGHVELKAPGTGANPNRFRARSHNGKQWERFKALPNLLYCDGNEWGLYRNGERERKIVRLSGEVDVYGKKAVAPDDAKALWGLLADFLSWKPIIPEKVEDLAGLLAPLCRMLRDDVTDALNDPASSLHDLAKDWRQLLFPDASDEQFADAYAQTVTFALLLARSERADPLTLDSAEKALAAEHTLLSRALQVLTDPNARGEISSPVDVLLRVIGEVPQGALTAEKDEKDPWLFFYEDFLAEYDPKLRKDAGAYYTPVEVVRAQVRLIDDLLTNRLGKSLGFADPDVITLDPAAGTGTYLLAVIDHAMAKVKERQKTGAVPAKAGALAKNIYGFEIMAGPFAVTELRVTRSLRDWGAKLPESWTQIYLTDTLEGPNTPPPALPFYLKPIAEQHAKALKVKAEVPVIVCLGNPPYDRHEAADADDPASRARTGHWVRWGDDGNDAASILRDFTEPAKRAGHGGHLKNLYNLYVYFWRWALWKVFESKTAAGPGVVSFISASSYLDGDAFCGMREHMRRVCDEVWILDLGGEGRGTRQTDNVFNIQTPVAIAVAFRRGEPDKETPAEVHYARIAGTEKDKLKALQDVWESSSLHWEDCPSDWREPFRPAGTGTYFKWPLLTDLAPWQQSGVKAGRTWVIAPDGDTLGRRWRALLTADKGKRPHLFKDSATGRKTTHAPSQLPPAGRELVPLTDLSENAPSPAVAPYAYRSFDRQQVFADARMLDRPGPSLWAAHGNQQTYLTTLVNHPLGAGPALTAAAELPDLHHFRGSYGAKEAIPLYRDAAADEPNILPGLLDLLGETYGATVTPEDFLAYVYGVLAHPAFTERFREELGTRELRVPLTKDAGLYAEVRDVGAKLLWLHTYGERYVPNGETKGQVPQGEAGCTEPVPQDEADYPEKYEYNEATKTLHVGKGEFAPVEPEVYEFEVSGLKVVQSWLGYRMKEPKGRRSSPLDDINPTRWPSEFTTELLELLWVLEHTLAEYPRQAELLDAVIDGPLFTADELPPVPDHMRKPPKRQKRGQMEFGDTADDSDGDE